MGSSRNKRKRGLSDDSWAFDLSDLSKDKVFLNGYGKSKEGAVCVCVISTFDMLT